jgi:hypothetical protein
MKDLGPATAVMTTLLDTFTSTDPENAPTTTSGSDLKEVGGAGKESVKKEGREVSIRVEVAQVHRSIEFVSFAIARSRVRFIFFRRIARAMSRRSINLLGFVTLLFPLLP